MTQHEELIADLRKNQDCEYSAGESCWMSSRMTEAADLIESQSREIARIEAENDLFRKHAAKQISDATLLTGINIGNGSMNMGLQGGAAQLLAESFFDQFKNSEAVNYLELRFESESKMPGKAMVVTLQLVGGLTPGQRIADQAREIAALKEQVEGLRKDAERWKFVESGYSGVTLRLHGLRIDQRAEYVDAAIAAKGDTSEG